jgi:uncharacterized SAM-binding protein YcdF (DUF218 family)
MDEVAGTSGAAPERQAQKAGRLSRAQQGRTYLRRARAIVLAAIAAAALGLVAGFVAFVSDVSAARPPGAAKAEGIVVLTGGSARIDTALHLLAEGHAHRLLISGVNPAVGSGAIAETVDPDLKSVIACCVDLGHEARDTIGNAAETRDWVRQHRYGSLIVVTSAYHMPRSLAELADALPEVSLIPYPISNPELHLADWWNEPEAFALLLREYGKYLLAAARLALGPPADGTPANRTVMNSP